MQPPPINYRVGYGSGYFLVFIHDIGNDLTISEDYRYLNGLGPGDVAGIYMHMVPPNLPPEEFPNVVYGAFTFATGTPVFGKDLYYIEFALPPLPEPDAFEVDDEKELATFIDYTDLAGAGGFHTFHDEGNGNIDYDWFRIALQAGDPLIVETFSAGGQWESNTQIDIYDSKMNFVTRNCDKAPEDCYSRLEYVNVTGVDQVFYILLKPICAGDGIEYSKIGEYKLGFLHY
jgi:hypothetical protein